MTICDVGRSFYSHSIFVFDICCVKDKKEPFQAACNTSHDSGDTSKKHTFLENDLARVSRLIS